MAKIKERKVYKGKICKNCGGKFEAYRPHAKFCCTACRAEFWRKEHPQLSAEERKMILSKLGIQERLT
jgi:protein-arginine kinase activator protein McsA